jgi:hypothetical protein
MSVIPCFLCGNRLDQRIDKNEKRYFICDPCGIQLFVRRKQGIERLDKYMNSFKRGEITFQVHSGAVAEIQGILVEINGVKTEIEKLESEMGFIFPDSDKVAARDALKKRLDRLLKVLEMKPENVK